MNHDSIDPTESGSAFGKGQWLYATPLLAAPMIPLSRILLRNYPRARNIVFWGLIAGFATHGMLLYSGTPKV